MYPRTNERDDKYLISGTKWNRRDMKKNKKLGYKTWLKHNCQDVTAKYKKDIVPNYGKVTFQNGYISDTSTKQDAKYAEFIQQKIGGNVALRC